MKKRVSILLLSLLAISGCDLAGGGETDGSAALKKSFEAACAKAGVDPAGALAACRRLEPGIVTLTSDEQLSYTTSGFNDYGNAEQIKRHLKLFTGGPEPTQTLIAANEREPLKGADLELLRRLVDAAVNNRMNGLVNR